MKVLEHKREELFELRQKKLDGMIVRSRTKWLFEVEKTTKYFCNLEKINFVQKAKCFTEKENGEVLHDSDAIMKETRCFYENLYASRENEIVNLETGNLMKTPTLTDEESNSLESLITEQEAHSALK